MLHVVVDAFVVVEAHALVQQLHACLWKPRHLYRSVVWADGWVQAIVQVHVINECTLSTTTWATLLQVQWARSARRRNLCDVLTCRSLNFKKATTFCSAVASTTGAPISSPAHRPNGMIFMCMMCLLLSHRYGAPTTKRTQRNVLRSCRRDLFFALFSQSTLQSRTCQEITDPGVVLEYCCCSTFTV